MQEVPTGDELLKVLGALGDPHRMRIVGALLEGRNYVSGLARELGIGRPLPHMHLQRLEATRLVVGTLELSESGLVDEVLRADAVLFHPAPSPSRRRR